MIGNFKGTTFKGGIQAMGYKSKYKVMWSWEIVPCLSHPLLVGSFWKPVLWATLTSTPHTLSFCSEKPAHVLCCVAQERMRLCFWGGNRTATDRSLWCPKDQGSCVFSCPLLPSPPPPAAATTDQSNKGTTLGKKAIFKPSPGLVQKTEKIK